MRKATWVHVAAGSDPASWTWSFGAKPAAVGTILAYSGVSTSAPVASSGGLAATSATITAPAATTQTAGDLVVGLFGVAKAAAVAPPTGLTETAEVTSPAGVTYPITGEAAHVTSPAAGTTSALVATSSVSGANIGQSVVLKAGTAGPPPPPDTQAPSVPTGLLVTPVAGGADLSWSASSDNVAVTGYRVRRDGASVGTTTATTFGDRNLAAGSTHSWTVEAYDAAGNTSAASAPPVTRTLPSDPPPSSGGVSLVAATTAANAATGTLTIAAPTSQAGDVLLASVDYRGQSAVTAPAGWSLVRSDASGTAMRKATWVHVAAGSDPASWTWSFSAKPAAVGTILAYSGVSTSAPVASSGGLAATSTAVTAPAATTQTAGDLVVGLFGVARTAAVAPPAGLTEVAEVTSPAGLTYPMTAEAAHVTPAAPGSTAALVATSTVSGPNVGQTIVLRATP